MRYYRLRNRGDDRLVVHDGERYYDLTAANKGLRSFRDLAKAAALNRSSIDRVADRNLEEATTLGRERVADEKTLPLHMDEVWAAGVTYQISEEAREEESTMPEMYLDAYHADRPEIFFKGTRNHTVGPDEAVGIRSDSEWDVPEPELGVVLYEGDIVGYTIGNDMSSRSIEGQNPLYLPQAKVYDRSCSIGPCVVSRREIADPHDLEMSMVITRNDTVVYEGTTSTGEMVRSCEELVSYYACHNAVPELAVLLTGTSLVPDEPFDLSPDDEVEVTIDPIGTLRNSATTV